LHLTQTRNSDLGFALAFPFSSTALTISGFETFGDNQFATPITLFPDLRNQEKYQLRYDLTHIIGSHALKFGVDFIHEPVLGGAFASTAEQFVSTRPTPIATSAHPAQIAAASPVRCRSTMCRRPRNAIQRPAPTPASLAPITPAGDGSFSQNVQRLAFYGEDSWRVSHHLTVNYGLRYQTTYGLFEGSGRSQLENSAYITLQALQIPVQQAFRTTTASKLRRAWASPILPAAARRPCCAQASACSTTTSLRTDGQPHFRESTTPTQPPARAS
jgi:outer membrane receptor protein involved in Fe transport